MTVQEAPYLCVYCTDGPHLTREEVHACYLKFLDWLDDPVEQAKCIYHDGPRHPELQDQLRCERRWRMADLGIETEEEYEAHQYAAHRRIQEAWAAQGLI